MPVYPSPWTYERDIEGFKKTKEFEDLGNRGLLSADRVMGGDALFWAMGAEEAARGALVAGVTYLVPGLMVPAQLANMAIQFGLMNAWGIQYEITPNRRLETPSGDEMPDLM